jgi:lipopolysaccharide/colanic/teichoic acid biosynthesis glycosyltransferase
MSTDVQQIVWWPQAGAWEPTFGPVTELEPVLARPMPWWKRAADVAGAALLLVAFGPLLLLMACLVRLTSHGPAIFKQWRAGQGGKPFLLYKFRSMVHDAEGYKTELMPLNEQSGPVFKMQSDPRVTRLGRFLRKWSIDELPQLWNVLKGDMSLVGPRPPTLDEVSHYQSWHWRRLDVRPGLTCFWQVSGRSLIGFQDWVRLDIRYVEEGSLLTDLKILAQTIPAVLSCKGAH